jgi:hypothetical protein
MVRSLDDPASAEKPGARSQESEFGVGVGVGIDIVCSSDRSYVGFPYPTASCSVGAVFNRDLAAAPLKSRGDWCIAPRRRAAKNSGKRKLIGEWR